MKSRITFFSVASFLMVFMLYTNGVIAQEQEHPMARMIGVWDMEAYKTEPAEVLAQMGTASKVEVSMAWSIDKRGIIQTNRTVANGEPQVYSITHFHDLATGTTHSISAAGTAKTTYPDEKTVKVEQFGFDGKLVNKQEVNFLNDDEAESVIEQSGGLKLWVKMKRRK